MKYNFVKYGTLACLYVNLTKGKSTRSKRFWKQNIKNENKISIERTIRDKKI